MKLDGKEVTFEDAKKAVEAMRDVGEPMTVCYCRQHDWCSHGYLYASPNIFFRDKEVSSTPPDPSI